MGKKAACDSGEPSASTPPRIRTRNWKTCSGRAASNCGESGIAQTVTGCRRGSHLCQKVLQRFFKPFRAFLLSSQAIST